MASTPDGKGYWMVAADGGVFTFGDAPFHGSGGGQVRSQSVVGLIDNPQNTGYQLVLNSGSTLSYP